MHYVTRLSKSFSSRQTFNRKCQSTAAEIVSDASRYQYYFVVIPKIGIAIGLSALTFQIGVLYPWHIELGDEFKALGVSGLILLRFPKIVHLTIFVLVIEFSRIVSE